MQILSEEGKARWEKAITGEVPFNLFRNFEHIRPYITDEQANQLDAALAKRNQKRMAAGLHTLGTFAHQNPAAANPEVRPEHSPDNDKKDSP